MSVYAKIAELKGDKPTTGINWQWTAFDSEDAAKQFVAWLDANGGDHRGVYPKDEKGKYAVRFR